MDYTFIPPAQANYLFEHHAYSTPWISQETMQILRSFAKAASDHVVRCSERLYNLGLFNTDQPKLANWYNAATYYANHFKYDTNINAIYKSAVEQYFHDTFMPNKYLPSTFFHDKQVNKAVAISHIVIYSYFNSTNEIDINSGSKKELAWLDITSCNSKNHIYGKADSGWSNIPYVAELLYPPLNLSKIVNPPETSMISDIKLWRQEQQIKDANKKIDDFFYLCMRQAIHSIINCTLKKSDIIRLFPYHINSAFKSTINACTSNYHQAIHSMITQYKNYSLNNEICYYKYASLIQSQYKSQGIHQDNHAARQFIEHAYINNKP